MWKVEDGVAINECGKCCSRCKIKCENECAETIHIPCEKCKYEHE